MRRLIPLALLCAALPVSAHEFWIEPQVTRPAPGSAYGLALYVGDGLPNGQPVPRDPARIRRFVTLDAGGERSVAGAAGRHPAGFARATSPGLQVVAYESDHAFIELTPERFASYLATDGLDAVAAIRLARGETTQPGRELYARCAKTLVRVGDGVPGDIGYSKLAGLTLELLPERDPTMLAGDPLPLRLLFRGEPLAGALVVARRRAGDGEATLSARTDAEGRVELPLDAPGFWLIGSVHMLAAEPDAGADWRSWWASLTFEAGTRTCDRAHGERC